MPTFLVLLSACEMVPFVTSEMAQERFDLDGDGVPRPDDCNDNDPNIGIVTQFADVDEDGYGYGVAVTQCAAIDGYAQVDGDCDDQDPALNPGAAEICDEIDNDCDGGVDVDPIDGDTYYADSDADAFGDAASTVISCSLPDGYVTYTTDCDDENAAINPIAVELCDDEIDNDCDGEIDEDASYMTQYLDADEDGYGDASVAVVDCNAVPGYVTDATDCDDTNSNVNPAAEEICNNWLDDDCDGGAGECGLASTVDLENADIVLHGEAASDFAGWSLAPAGDVNDDGYADLLIGAIYNDNVATDAGVVYIVSGPLSEDENLASAYAILVGESASDFAGTSIAAAGNFSGDGIPDLIIGASSSDQGAANAGAAYLVQGPLQTTESLSEAATIFIGTSVDENAGASVSTAGDVNNDEYDDILVGAPLHDGGATNSGAAYLLFGSGDEGIISLTDAAGIVLLGETASDDAGRSVSNAGDVNGDGSADILVGAPGKYSATGAVYLIHGPRTTDTTVSLADADSVIVGEASGDYFGIVLACAGDSNHDGNDEVLIGAYGNDTAGSGTGTIYLFTTMVNTSYFASDANTILTGEEDDDQAGISAVSTGDLNEDDMSDIFVGANRNDRGGTDSGAAYLLLSPITSGTVSLGSSSTIFIGEVEGDRAGGAVSSAGDLNHDEFLDVAIGAIYNDRNGNESGSVFIVFDVGI